MYVFVCTCVWLAGNGLIKYNTKFGDTHYDALNYTANRYGLTTPSAHTSRSVHVYYFSITL